MVFLHVAVECFQIELQLAEMLWLEFFDLKFDSNQTIQPAMKEQQVNGEIAPTDLNAELASEYGSESCKKSIR